MALQIKISRVKQRKNWSITISLNWLCLGTSKAYIAEIGVYDFPQKLCKGSFC
jgi:hypothetical protein